MKKLPTKEKDQSEHEIQNQTLDALRAMHYQVFRANVTKDIYRIASLPTGFPDIFGYVPHTGQIFFIEMKDAKGKPSEAQVKYHHQFMKDGVIHGLARSPEDGLLIVKEQRMGYGFEDDTGATVLYPSGHKTGMSTKTQNKRIVGYPVH